MKIPIEEEIGLLRKVPLFQNLKPEELKIISLAMENFIYDKDEIILHEGDEGDEAFVIYSGKAEVYKKSPEGKELYLNSLGPGDIFGELAIFGEGFRSASVRAVTEILVGSITKDKLFEIIREFPDIAIELLKVQTQRFFRAENRLMQFLKDGKKEGEK